MAKDIWNYFGKWMLCGMLAGLVILGLYKVTSPKPDPVFHESLTVKEIKENMPRKYGYVLTRTDYNMSEGYQNEVHYEREGKLFAIDSTSISINSSGIEDGMIYTSTREMQEDGTIVERLYINEPYTLELIAMGETIKDENRDLYLLYTIMDKDGFTWYDKHNANLCESED